MSFGFWNFIKSIFFRFDAESIHKFVVRLIQIGILCKNKPLYWISGADRSRNPDARLHKVFDLEFLNPVGLAAGFDKNAEILQGLPALGFGFAEIGTVTPRPQAGNPRPRLFREPDKKSILNRMGFNGLGSTVVSQRVAKIKLQLPSYFRVGINLGKNKDTPNEDAWKDYVQVVTRFEGLADYFVINVSSPNTPGLRSLQTVEALKPIVGEVNSVMTKWGKRPPLLLKLAPELKAEALKHLIESLEGEGIDGWVLTNTLGDLQGRGGWSGLVLQEAARESLRHARQITRKPIISVGGIVSAEEASGRMALGADLVQIYTGWIYSGPKLPAQIAKQIANP